MAQNNNNILHQIKAHITNIAEEIQHDIALLNTNNEQDAKIRSQKELAESLLKITNIMQNIKKLEKIYDEEGDWNHEEDQKILQEFIQKIKKGHLGK